jgi:hypothetical protein
MITLDTKTNKFSFVVEQIKLDNAIQTMASQSSKEATFVFASSLGKLWICCISAPFTGIMEVEATVTGSGNFSMDPQVLKGIIKGRNKLELTYTGAELEYKALKTKYAGRVNTFPVTKEQAASFNTITNEKVKGVKLSEDTLSDIVKGIKNTSIKSILTGETVNSLVNLKDGKLAVSAFDDHHIIVYTAKTGEGEIKFSISPITLVSIEKSLEGKITLSVKPEVLRFTTKTAMFIIPTYQAEAEKYNIARDYLKNLGSAKFDAQVNAGQLVAVCENFDAIHTVNSQFDFSIEKGLKVQFKTEQGAASDTLATDVFSGKGKCSVNPKSLTELLMLFKNFNSSGDLVLSGYETVAGLECKHKKAKLQAVCVLTNSGN